jgi:CheY-like chemotaxis protein
LLADANPYSRSAIAAQLQEWGGDVLVVDGREPMLGALRDNLAIDLVICDVDWYESALHALAERTLAGQRGDARNLNGQDAPVLRGPVILQLAKWGVETSNTHIKTPGRADRKRNGSEVLLRPVKPSALAEALARLMQPATDEQSVSVAIEPTYAATEKSQPPLLSAELPARILLVEDNLVNQRVALRMLDRLGYRADLAANGVEALSALATGDYDVVFMDIHMPEMDGQTATRKIHAEFPPERRPYIIAMTADAMPGYREECLAAGMDDYIAKPVRLEDLADALRRLFDRSTASEV